MSERKMITLKDVMNSNSETKMLEGNTEEILAQGLAFTCRDMLSYVGDIQDGLEVENIELFLIRQQNNMARLLALLDKEVVIKMLDLVHEDTKRKIKK